MTKKQVSNPFLTEVDGRKMPSEEGLNFLDRAVTDAEGQVYAFTGELPGTVIAAAMARLSRRAGDMRTTILDEFTSPDQDEVRLIKDVVSKYGDDSVQQLVYVSVVAESVSNLATKALEWGRLMAYLEQSTRYIYFDQKGADGRYNFIPLPYLKSVSEELVGAQPLAEYYEQAMEKIFDNYSLAVHRLTDYVRAKHPQGEESRSVWIQTTRAQACDAARVLLPVGTRSTVGLVGSAQAMEALVMRLLSEDLPEFQDLGRNILAQLRKVIPAFMERADMPERGGALSLYRRERREAMSAWADRLAAVNLSTEESVKVTSLIPEDIDRLVAEMLFSQSVMSLDQILKQVGLWPQEKKLEVIHDYMGKRLNRRQKPGRALEFDHFEVEIASDYGCFRDLQRHRMVDGMEFQPLTPYLGYEVPGLAIEAGQESLFHETFALSSGLYDKIASSGFMYEAQYATLMGHRMRYRWAMNMREAFHFLELRTQPAGHPGYRRLCQEIYRQLTEQYPVLSQYMTFINQGEDPELTRLAAERVAARRRAELGFVDEEDEE